MFGDILLCHNLMGTVTGIQQVEARDSAEHTVHRTTAHTKNYQAWNVNSAEVEKPFSRSYYCSARRVSQCLSALAIGHLSTDNLLPHILITHIQDLLSQAQIGRAQKLLHSQRWWSITNQQTSNWQKLNSLKSPYIGEKEGNSIYSYTMVKYMFGKPERQIIQQCLFRF